MPSPADLLAQRVAGTRPTGTVSLRSFDQGIVETLGATVIGNRYYVQIAGVEPPPGDPGIAVHFMFPEDLYANFRYPAFVVTRDDISISFGRLHPGLQQFRAPAPDALPVKVQTPSGERSYFDRTIQRAQARPYDITYTVNMYSSLRGGAGGKKAANEMLDHVLRIFPDYSQVFVTDSLGDTRTYEAFNEGITSLDDVAGVSERIIQYAVTIRVEAEYDLSPDETARTVTSHPITHLSRK